MAPNKFTKTDTMTFKKFTIRDAEKVCHLIAKEFTTLLFFIGEHAWMLPLSMFTIRKNQDSQFHGYVKVLQVY